MIIQNKFSSSIMPRVFISLAVCEPGSSVIRESLLPRIVYFIFFFFLFLSHVIQCYVFIPTFSVFLFFVIKALSFAYNHFTFSFMRLESFINYMNKTGPRAKLLFLLVGCVIELILWVPLSFLWVVLFVFVLQDSLQTCCLFNAKFWSLGKII